MYVRSTRGKSEKKFQIPGNSKVINILLFLKEKAPQAFLYSFYLFEFLNIALSFRALKYADFSYIASRAELCTNSLSA
jgi:hypothetical protein